MGSLAGLLALSGAAALTMEVVWMRRLSLVVGGSALATTLVLSLYMGGLGLGGAWSGRVRWGRPARAYGLLELAVAGWAAAFPLIADLLGGAEGLGGQALGAALLLVPPGFLHGATLPAAAGAARSGREAGGLYAANTAGAVAGTLAAPFLWLPLLGVRGTELLAAGAAATAGVAAIALGTERVAEVEEGGPAPGDVLVAACAAGFVAMALEVVWARLGALLLGGSVYAFAIVLAVFLGGIAIGAEFGRRLGLRPAIPLAALGLLAAGGTAGWALLPYGLGLAWEAGGDSLLLPAGAALLAIAMAGAPIASGATFAACLRRGTPGRAAGAVLAANTAGGVLGAALAGLVALPALGVRGTALAVASLGVLVAVVLPGDRRLPAAALGALGLLAVLSPRWDPALYAAGLYSRLERFADLSPRAIDAWAHEGWSLRFYRDGRTATVAVGASARTGRRWLSINGKVDASDGRDMPTQRLSASIPVGVARAALGEGVPLDALVVGLASGVTAGEALAAGASAVTVVELEPAVVEASAWFDHVNRGVLADPRTTLVVGDARAVLARSPERFHVIISEPSNPWLTGVSNLFTREYWALARARLDEPGVFCQWVQLYSLPPAGFRSLVRTFLDVFPDAVLYETIPGADALLVASVGAGAPPAPALDAAALRRLAGLDGGLVARPNTDDRPWIEFEAPWWLHRDTAERNRALLHQGSGLAF